jgi:hypothetical protein
MGASQPGGWPVGVRYNWSAGMKPSAMREDGKRPLVSRVDHLYARVDDPRRLFATLTERLGLPRSYGFTRLAILEGGAVSLGNVVFLEALRYAPARMTPRPLSPGLDGLALEAGLPLREAASELSRRGIAHSPPVTYTGEIEAFDFGEALQRAGLNSGTGPVWSMLGLGGFLGDARLARLLRLVSSRGDSRIALALGRLQGRLMSSRRLGGLVMARTMSPHPTVWLHAFEAADMRAAAAAAAEELSGRGGGALGLERVREVVLGARDLATEQEHWQRLLAPARPGPDGAWQLGDGSALRLVSDELDRIQALVCEVSSLERAGEFLGREGMLADGPAGEVRIAPDALQGVDLRLVESRAVPPTGEARAERRTRE